jgi:hypothetical protein
MSIPEPLITKPKISDPSRRILILDVNLSHAPTYSE